MPRALKTVSTSISLPLALIAATDSDLRALLRQAVRQAAADVRAGRLLPEQPEGPAPSTAAVGIVVDAADLHLLRVACASAGRSLSSVIARYVSALVEAGRIEEPSEVVGR
jgi:hypothetical protein